MTKNFRDFQEIIRGSKQYEFEGTVLTITGYYTGKRVSIDLSMIDEDTFLDIVPEDDEDEYDEEDEEYDEDEDF